VTITTASLSVHVFHQPYLPNLIPLKESQWSLVKSSRTEKAESRAKAKVTICTLSNSGQNITKKSPFSICIFLRALTFKKYAFYTVNLNFFAYFLENH
jgi:hypothetical protein